MTEQAPPRVRSRWPVFDEAQRAAVDAVLASGRVNAWTGPDVDLFEEAYAAHLGRRHAIALANGTVALDVVLRALRIGPGDEVIVSPRSFFASAGCVALAGATPVFADVDPDSQNLTAATIASCITPRTRAVIVVHLAGWPADMPAIVAAARRHAVAVIEDCAQAHGATVDGRPVGSFGDVAAFSFCQDKIITTMGEGGLVATDDADLHSRMWSFKDHGKSLDAVRRTDHPAGFRWLHETFGTNLRMTGPQATIGRIQLARLDESVAARNANAAALLDALAAVPGLRVPRPGARFGHAHYRAYAFVKPAALRPGWTRDRIMAAVAAAGVPCFVGSCSEIYRERAFQAAGLAPERPLPVARALGETGLCFLVDPTLSPADMAVVADVVRATMAAATEPVRAVAEAL